MDTDVFASTRASAYRFDVSNVVPSRGATEGRGRGRGHLARGGGCRGNATAERKPRASFSLSRKCVAASISLSLKGFIALCVSDNAHYRGSLAEAIQKSLTQISCPALRPISRAKRSSTIFPEVAVTSPAMLRQCSWISSTPDLSRSCL